MCIKTLETGKPFITQYLLEATGKWLEVSVSKMDEDHLIHIFTDVSSIKQAQLIVERSATQLQTIITRTQSGIFTLAPVKDEGGQLTDFRFVVVNRALAAYVNQEPEALTGKLCSEWFRGYKTNGLFELFSDTYFTGKSNRFDFHYNADGIDAWIDMLCTPFDGELLVTFTDYTPVKKLQLQVERTVEELKQSNQSLEEFAYAASHDLQEPLRKIHTFSDRLRHELSAQLNSVQQMLFERIESAAQRMRTLIDDLLAYAQVSRRFGDFKTMHLNSVIEAALQDLETSINETGAVITADNLATIRGDERQLRQMFQNLIGNAIKYRKPDVAPRITITCSIVEGNNTENLEFSGEHNREFYEIKVADNGIGFEQQYAESIFEVFHRLHGRSEYEGTGIGLAIVQRVVQNHGGYITAEGTPGIGATFRVMLPA
jgi:signal transduction histidine kinase